MLNKAKFKGKLVHPCLMTAAALTLAPAFANASSFYILEQSPSHLGHAFSGTASNIMDATTVYFNPAGMSQLDQRELTVGGNIIMARSNYDDVGSNTGNFDGRTDETGFVPNIYYVHPFNEQWTFGFGINAPFGLSSDYGDQWAGRYLATNSELEVINVNANASFEINEQFSLGIGLNLQRLDVTLENQVDSTFGDNPQPETDSAAYISGDDQDVTIDISALYRLTEATTFGLIWRQGGSFAVSGHASFDLNPACTQGTGEPNDDPTEALGCAGVLAMLEGPVRTDVSLPDVITFSASHQLNEEWALHGDIAWTQWGDIQYIDIVNTDNSELVESLELEYDDTLRVALGATYDFGAPWTFRFGIARDQAPQTSPIHVTPRVPDGDRTWLSAGFNYQFSEELSVDFGYAHLFVDSVDIAADDQQTGHSVRGNFDSKVDILSAQVNWNF